MIRASILLAGLSALAFVAPAAAQSHHGGHQDPQPPAKTDMATVDPSCSPEHAAMGHCTPKPGGNSAPPPSVDDADCPAEHAVMGHCTPKVRAKEETTGAAGTDLPAGDAPAPPPPGDWYADRYFSKADMDHSRHAMMIENGGQKTAFISINLAEYQARKGRDGFRWEGEGWYGGDIDRLTMKSEGEAVFGEGVESAELQLLYSRAIGPYFNAQVGIRQDMGQGPGRTYAVIGFEGLAPYWFETEGALFLSEKGDLLGRLEVYYDQRITQKLILQPMAEVNFAVQKIPESGIGSGVSDVELGLRLRYEIVREFAPYVGVEWARKIGDTARLARASGEDPDALSLVVGVKAWF
ncbi:MAG: copper resistance protein B [Sphingomonadales bacterium]|nr:MAG: copper resistance protein B [Sphingomonadales bacterium]